MSMDSEKINKYNVSSKMEEYFKLIEHDEEGKGTVCFPENLTSYLNFLDKDELIQFFSFYFFPIQDYNLKHLNFLAYYFQEFNCHINIICERAAIEGATHFINLFVNRCFEKLERYINSSICLNVYYIIQDGCINILKYLYEVENIEFKISLLNLKTDIIGEMMNSDKSNLMIQPEIRDFLKNNWKKWINNEFPTCNIKPARIE